MHAGFLGESDRLGAGDANGVALDLDVQAGLVDAGQLGDDHVVVALTEDVQWWIGPAGARAGLQPRTGVEGFQRLLQVEQGFKCVWEHHDPHLLLSAVVRVAGQRALPSAANVCSVRPVGTP
jgi:hypothetical protein